MKKRVFVGMSGGVDSSVAAALLLKNGYEVEGISLILTPNAKEEDFLDAKAVCDALEIPFHLVDAKKEFKERVITNFIEEYRAGRTPNPCIICNEYIKFGVMLDKALELGADYLATGHYANIENKDGRFILKAANSAKDQSYFLYRLNQTQLSHIMFPMASYEKADTRKMAKELGLPVAEKSDSQEICFILDDDYARFLKEYAGIVGIPGNFVNLEGDVIGQHAGIINFTIGQRKGLGMAFGEPMFVTKIDAKTNEVVLAPNGFQNTKEFLVTDLSEPITEELKANVKVRFRANRERATIIPLDENSVKVIFDEPQRAVTPGQSAVFYDGDTVLGGGFISNLN